MLPQIDEEYLKEVLDLYGEIRKPEMVAPYLVAIKEWRKKLPTPKLQVGDVVRCVSHDHIALQYVGLKGVVSQVGEQLVGKRKPVEVDYGGRVSNWVPEGLGLTYVVNFNYTETPKGERCGFLSIEHDHLGDFEKVCPVSC